MTTVSGGERRTSNPRPWQHALTRKLENPPPANHTYETEPIIYQVSSFKLLVSSLKFPLLERTMKCFRKQDSHGSVSCMVQDSWFARFVVIHEMMYETGSHGSVSCMTQSIWFAQFVAIWFVCLVSVFCFLFIARSCTYLYITHATSDRKNKTSETHTSGSPGGPTTATTNASTHSEMQRQAHAISHRMYKIASYLNIFYM